MKGNIAAIVLILTGVFFLGRNLGWFSISLMELIATWWPVVLIVIGAGMFAMPKERADHNNTPSKND